MDCVRNEVIRKIEAGNNGSTGEEKERGMEREKVIENEGSLVN